MTMGERIKELRKKNKMTQEELGARVGLQKSAIAKYESGRVTNIKRSTIDKMAQALGVRPSYLMGWDGDVYKDPNTGKIITWGNAVGNPNFTTILEYVNGTETYDRKILNDYYIACTEQEVTMLTALSEKPLLKKIVLALAKLDDEHLRAFAVIAGVSTSN